MLMKKQFLKSVLLVSAALALVNCDDKAADAISNLTPDANIPASSASGSATVDPSEACWLMEANGAQYLVYPTGIITDINGQTIAQVTLTQDETGAFTGTATSFDGTPIFEINTADLKVVTLEQVAPAIPASSATALPPASSATVPVLSSATIPAISSSSLTTPVVLSSSATVVVVSSSAEQQQPKSSAAVSGNCDGKCFDSVSGKCVDYYAEQTGSKGEKYAYDNTCKLNCYHDPDGKDCKNISGAAPASSASQQPKSSSSVKSSSSQQQQQQSSSSVRSSSSAKSSSSSAKSSSSQGNINSSYQIKYVNGGKSGSGYATRYWDCCKPHCAWPEHGGTASTCDARGNKITDKSAGSMCDGGNAGICRNQFPIIVNDQLAFAFAATPGGENNCGKCFDLQFTGEGKYASTSLHKSLVGKHLIVMSNNVGYDVAGGQFDVMIPGGGFGIFDGCSAKMGWGSQGSQYGGLLDECEKESNYKADKYKSCLQNKCAASFSSDPEAKEGCLFLANWLNAAGNPLLTYKEVECPQELINRF